MTSASAVQWGKTWLVVTGASRGFGAAICQEFSKHMADGSVILGFARTLKGLVDTSDRVQEANPGVQFVSANVDVTTCDVSMYEEKLADSYKNNEADFQTVILVHNVGSLGSLNYLREIDNAPEINEYFKLNVSSLMPLTSIFLRLSRALPSQPKIYVINVSSLCAISPFKSWGLYCIAKAARDMMFKVLALEEGDDVMVLNYAPGPLEGDMQIEVREHTQDPELKAIFINMKNENKLLPPEVSINKLIDALASNKYKTGDHFDYYD